MTDNINQLIKRFEQIKREGLHISMRKGYTGIGYTFECLIGKNEDTSYNPDYKGIEIKTKLGYSKTPINLFSLTPKSSSLDAIKELVEKFGYPDKNMPQYKVLRASASTSNQLLVANRYFFCLKINRSLERIELLIKNRSGDVISNDLYWEFEELKKRVETKLNYMAIVIGYPYVYNQQTYYKYFKMIIYKLKSFDVFLDLIESGIISIVFNIGIYKSAEYLGNTYDHGTYFKISIRDVYKLFDKVAQSA